MYDLIVTYDFMFVNFTNKRKIKKEEKLPRMEKIMPKSETTLWIGMNK